VTHFYAITGIPVPPFPAESSKAPTSLIIAFPDFLEYKTKQPYSQGN